MKTEFKTKCLQPFVSNASTGRIAVASLIGLLSAATLTSCASDTYRANLEQQSAQQKQATGTAMPEAQPATEADARVTDGVAAAGEVARSRPQLIKKAELNLLVKSIDPLVKEVSAIVRKQQGDIMGFQDYKPQDPSTRQTASMQIRIPQPKLETTLEQLTKLGTVQNRSLTAEDVSDQLVDIDARLRNLRKAEQLTLKIMERSGSVGDILKASKEVSSIRESIERLDAQQRSLRDRVAYSTINLTLEAAVAASPTTQPSLSVRMQESWGQATHSVSEFTLGLLSLTLWLLAFSPYLLFIGAAIYGYRRFRKYKSLPAVRELEQPASK